MEENKIDLDGIEIPAPERAQLKADEGESEGVRFYTPPRTRRSRGVPFFWQFVLMTLIFALIFACAAALMRNKDDKADVECGIPPRETTVDSTEACEETEVPERISYPPVVIDESKTEIELELTEDYSLSSLIGSSEGVKILILHSHNSEKVSETITVSDAGQAIAQIISSAGLGVYHCDVEHDGEGSVGAYIRMKQTLSVLLERYPDVVCVIDIHDSDSGLPVTFTVGTDYDGWRENLRLAEAICGGLRDTETAFRLLPGTLGQDSGVLTLSVGICGGTFSDDEAREAIAALTEAIINICNEKASVPQ